MSGTQEFYKSDFMSTLFPLKTNLLMVMNHEEEIKKYIYNNILNPACPNDNFLPQQRVYSTKPQGHLRRTLKLDPVSEYFIYDIIYRNKAIFRGSAGQNRMSYGYRFKDGNPIPIHVAYKEYKQHLNYCENLYEHRLHFDIASYFNCVYHHDLTHWFESYGSIDAKDHAGLGKFFREINSGRSVDFLPQGIYPCKMIGNEFLKYIDLTKTLKSAVVIRFMDDFSLFDESPEIIQQDFIRIQQLLGLMGLNINPSKTMVDRKKGDVNDIIVSIKDALKGTKTTVEPISTASGVEWVEIKEPIEHQLNQDQIQVLLKLLKEDSLEESDADLILNFLRAHSDSVIQYFPVLLQRFPNMTKHIYSISSTITEKEELITVIADFLSNGSNFLEYQLFWLAALTEDFLLGIKGYGDLLFKLYELSSEYKIARSKVLEIPEQGYGFKEIRSELLKTGQSDWLAWSAAAGSRSLKTAERNYALDYFSKGSPMNYMISSCIKAM